jgi:hypothetical protein
VPCCSDNSAKFNATSKHCRSKNIMAAAHVRSDTIHELTKALELFKAAARTRGGETQNLARGGGQQVQLTTGLRTAPPQDYEEKAAAKLICCAASTSLEAPPPGPACADRRPLRRTGRQPGRQSSGLRDGCTNKATSSAEARRLCHRCRCKIPDREACRGCDGQGSASAFPDTVCVVLRPGTRKAASSE